VALPQAPLHFYKHCAVCLALQQHACQWEALWLPSRSPRIIVLGILQALASLQNLSSPAFLLLLRCQHRTPAFRHWRIKRACSHFEPVQLKRFLTTLIQCRPIRGLFRGSRGRGSLSSPHTLGYKLGVGKVSRLYPPNEGSLASSEVRTPHPQVARVDDRLPISGAPPPARLSGAGVSLKY